MFLKQTIWYKKTPRIISVHLVYPETENILTAYLETEIYISLKPKSLKF